MVVMVVMLCRVIMINRIIMIWIIIMNNCNIMRIFMFGKVVFTVWPTNQSTDQRTNIILYRVSIDTNNCIFMHIFTVRKVVFTVWPTNQPTDRPTLSNIECLSTLIKMQAWQFGDHFVTLWLPERRNYQQLATLPGLHFYFGWLLRTQDLDSRHCWMGADSLHSSSLLCIVRVRGRGGTATDLAVLSNHRSSHYIACAPNNAVFARKIVSTIL